MTLKKNKERIRNLGIRDFFIFFLLVFFLKSVTDW